jgi:hypothetical protein
VFRHGFRDRLVEATIQRVKFFGRDRNLLLDGDFGDGLTDIAVIMDHLRNVEPECPQFTPVLCR